MNKAPKLDKKKTKNLMKYTGLGLQMAAVFSLGIFGGQWLDKFFGFDQPIITILLLLVLFIGFMYKLFVDLGKE